MAEFYVITVVENRETVTRVRLGCSLAQEFMAWIVAQGRIGSMRFTENWKDERSTTERQRASDMLSTFLHTRSLK